MNTNPTEIKLSNQARWYLAGRWPVYRKSNNDPEPTAMAELVDRGLAIYYDNAMTPYWAITNLGVRVRGGNPDCPACQRNGMHTHEERKKYHPEAGTGFSKEHGTPKSKN